MADDILSGGQPPVNNTNTFYNGYITVPTYLCAPEVVDINNYKTILIGGGYYTEEDLT
jgi:putative multiple sugar transport system substrate-binding protein